MKMYTKITISTIILVFLHVQLISAATLIWSPPDTGTINGFKVHYGTSSTNPSETIDVGNNTYLILDNLSLSDNTEYFFCVSAYNTSEESAPCAPVAYTPADTTPPLPPVGLVAE